MGCYVYTETAFHHEGDYEYLIELINASKRAGANGVKFQVLLDAGHLMSSRHSLYDELTTCLFTQAQWASIFHHCLSLELDIIMMPVDKDAFALLAEPGIQVAYLDLHSVLFCDEEILHGIKRSQIPLILGIGGRTLEEIQEKYAYFGEQLRVLMVGFQSFPSKLEDIKLKKIQACKTRFPEMAVGYADHSAYNSEYALKSNEYAYILGATCFEKHLTLTEGHERLDYQSAVGEASLKRIIETLTFLDQHVFAHPPDMLFELNAAETAYRNRQKVAVAHCRLPAGHVLKIEDILFKMIDKPDGLTYIDAIVGRRLTCGIQPDDILTLEHVGL